MNHFTALCIYISLALVLGGVAAAVGDPPAGQSPAPVSEMFEQQLQAVQEAVNTGKDVEGPLRLFISSGMTPENRAAFIAVGETVWSKLPEEAGGELRLYVAMAHSREGNSAGAEKILQELQEHFAYPGTRLGYLARYEHAQLLIGGQKYEESEPILDELWKNVDTIDPQLAPILGGQLVDVSANLKKWNKVIEVATSPFVIQDTGSQRVLFRYEDLGRAYMETGQFELALKTYEDLAYIAGGFEQNELGGFTKERIERLVKEARDRVEIKENMLKAPQRAAVRDLEQLLANPPAQSPPEESKSAQPSVNITEDYTASTAKAAVEHKRSNRYPLGAFGAVGATALVALLLLMSRRWLRRGSPSR